VQAPASNGDALTRVVALAKAQAPLRRALARVAGRLVEARAWERLGYARLRDYAVERAGLSARQLQDLAHVDGALARLPRLEAAFVAGDLTWTQTRLLARVATPEDETRWIAFARQLTAGALAREVRAVDRRTAEATPADPDDPDAERREAVKIRCDRGVRSKWLRTRWLARLAAGERLPMWACMESVAAEVLSAIPLEGDDGWSAAGPEPLRAEAAATNAPTWEPANGCATHGFGGQHREPLLPDGHAAEAAASPGTPAPWPAFLRLLVTDVDEADPFELDARLRRALRLAQRFEAAMGPLLIEVAAGRRYRDGGHASLDAFAREALGMAPRKAQALLRLERVATVCPPLRKAYRTGRLSWVQAHVLVPLLMLEHAFPWRAAWAAHAQHVSVRRLEDDVDRAIASGDLDPEAHAASAGTWLERPDVEDPQTGAHPMGSGERVRISFGAPREVARLFRAALAAVQRRLERKAGRPFREGEALETMLDHAAATWTERPGRLPREYRVFERDGWRCTVPGCTSYRNLHRHHIAFRSAGGSDEPCNCTTLCAFHHLRGVHAGTVACSGEAPDALRFALGLRRGYPPMLDFGPGERLA
jgi:hypothetical protein